MQTILLKDYYQILHINRNARADDIKKAYRQLAMKYHPDINTTENAQEMFVLINEANETLSDPVKRKLYDARLIYGYSTGTLSEKKDEAYYKKYGTHKKYSGKTYVKPETPEVRFKSLETIVYYIFLTLGLLAFFNSLHEAVYEDFNSHTLNGLIFSTLFTFLLYFSWNKFYKK